MTALSDDELRASTWRVAYFPTIMSGPVARFRSADGRQLEVNASRDGIGTNRSGGWGGFTTPEEQELVMAAAQRVHEALRAAYARRFHGPTDAAECIRVALGEGWELECPAVFSTWPEEPS